MQLGPHLLLSSLHQIHPLPHLRILPLHLKAQEWHPACTENHSVISQLTIELSNLLSILCSGFFCFSFQLLIFLCPLLLYSLGFCSLQSFLSKVIYIPLRSILKIDISKVKNPTFSLFVFMLHSQFSPVPLPPLYSLLFLLFSHFRAS